MATLRFKRGSGIPAGLSLGEPAYDFTNNRLYVGVTGGVALVGASGAIGVASFNGLTGAVTGVTTGTANTFGPLQSFTNGISSAGGTFSGNVRLQNAEYIQNTTNGRVDIMPGPNNASHYGLYVDTSSWGFGTQIGTLRSSDNASNIGAILCNTDFSLSAGKVFAFEPGQTLKFLSTGIDVNTLRCLQMTLNMAAGSTGNALVLMDTTSTGYGGTRVPNVYFSNPTFMIYSNVNIRSNANDFVRFEHNIDNGRMISGGTSGISLEPGSGSVGVSGSISSSGFILTSDGIKSLTGTTYTFLASDNGDVITHNNGSGCTFTIPTGLPVGFSTTVIRLNSAGRVAFTAASGVTLNSYGGFTGLAGQHASASLISYASNIFNLSGNLI